MKFARLTNLPFPLTGLVLAGAVGSASGERVHLSLIERAGTRGKAETKIRTAHCKPAQDGPDCLRLDLVDVSRTKCDLAHVDMAAAVPPRLRSRASTTVVVAKHLCGAGTDLALKSLRISSARRNLPC